MGEISNKSKKAVNRIAYFILVDSMGLLGLADEKGPTSFNAFLLGVIFFSFKLLPRSGSLTCHKTFVP